MRKNTLIGRGKLIFNWMPNDIDNVLEVGCASGEYISYYSERCKKIFGIDPNEDLIKKAKLDYPKIDFRIGSAENIPFKDKIFDVVILGDVLEHVNNEAKSLNEIYRVLKSEGILILTVPHKGLFSFMDVDNYSWYYRKLFMIETKKPGYENKHKHYSLKDLENLFLNKFEILNIYRSSLFLIPFVLNLRLLIRNIFGEKIDNIIRPYSNKLIDIDFFISYGRLSYSIGIKAKKI